jgi:hypothetical protein
MPLTIPSLARLKTSDPYLHDVFTKFLEHINTWQQQSGVAPQGQLPAPPAIGGLSVTAANGWFEVTITDKNAQQPGVQYFLEYDTLASFQKAKTIPLGPTRTPAHFYLGNLTLYWRAYSSYQGSASSPKVVFGAPTAVAGGGATAPGAFQSAQGSGTSQAPGNGFGTPGSQIQGKTQTIR